MDVRKAHIINPQLEVFPMLCDRQLMISMAKVARKVALELLLVRD